MHNFGGEQSALWECESGQWLDWIVIEYSLQYILHAWMLLIYLELLIGTGQRYKQDGTNLDGTSKTRMSARIR